MQEYFSKRACLNALFNSRSNSSEMRTLKDKIQALYLSEKGYPAKEAEQLLDEIFTIKDFYERKWLVRLLDWVMLEKSLTAIRYQPAENVNIAAMKAA